MIATIIILAIIYAIILIIRACPPMFDEEEYEETTTTTVTKPEYSVAGCLKRQYGNESNTPQCFVTDPADGQKIFVNAGDDMYEDAAGKVWRLT